MADSIIIRNSRFTLELSTDGCAVSLLVGGVECLSPEEPTPFFSVTQDRPFNNEVKLAHPNKRTTYPANRISAEPSDGGMRLRVGFEIAPYDALVDVGIKDDYVSFTLAGFDCPPNAYGLCMTPPPAAEFRLCALSLIRREHFGAWMNVEWDDEAAVAVMAATPNAIVDSEKFSRRRLLYADARRDLNLIGVSAALFAAPAASLLDCVDSMERDFNLPLGVESRRSGDINGSIFWTASCTPETVDDHIKWAKLGGFRYIMIYYTALFKERGGYSLDGDYDWRDEYPRGLADAKAMLDKIKSAGITPGLHFLQTHIGLNSRYCTPVADPRLGKIRRFTLAKCLSADDTEIEVEEDPTGCVMYDGCRILQLGGELVHYDAYTTERPYRFTGCERGHRGTNVVSHSRGETLSLLDVSEFGATSCYVDQTTSLQDEIADKIAEAYSAGFRFCYFDGSEGTNVPYEYYIPLAQYRVWKKLEPKPLFTEGAAKAHFSWHHLSGGNAFDIFPPSIFKAMIRKYPAEEAPRMAEDFTSLNFGWWGFWTPDGREDGGTQADQLEYGTSRAAGWDCPATIQINISALEKHPRARDIMEVMRRWEDVRLRGWLTEEQKAELRDLDTEHTLIINEAGEYELVKVKELTTSDPDIRAFGFVRGGRSYASVWHARGEKKVFLPLAGECFVSRDIGGGEIPCGKTAEGMSFCLGDRVYISFAGDIEELAQAVKGMKFCQ